MQVTKSNKHKLYLVQSDNVWDDLVHDDARPD